MIKKWLGGEKGSVVHDDEGEGAGEREGAEDKGRKHDSREMKNVEEEEMNDNEGYDNKVHAIKRRRNNYNSPKIIKCLHCSRTFPQSFAPKFIFSVEMMN